MARRPVTPRRVRGALRVYDRSGIWWAQVPGVGRRTLGLRVDDGGRSESPQAFAASSESLESYTRGWRRGAGLDQ